VRRTGERLSFPHLGPPHHTLPQPHRPGPSGRPPRRPYCGGVLAAQTDPPKEKMLGGNLIPCISLDDSTFSSHLNEVSRHRRNLQRCGGTTARPYKLTAVSRHSGVAVRRGGASAWRHISTAVPRRCDAADGGTAVLRHDGTAVELDTHPLFNNSGRKKEPQNRHRRREHAPSRFDVCQLERILHVGLHHSRTSGKDRLTLGLLELHRRPSEAGGCHQGRVRIRLTSLTLCNGGPGFVRISKEIKCFYNREQVCWISQSLFAQILTFTLPINI
jgi:hypothetical protein